METFSKFFQSIPNKIKALYLVWFLIHLILFLCSVPAWLVRPDIKNGFYPFSPYGLDSYDYSEFLIYILSPIFIYAIIYLWKKK